MKIWVTIHKDNKIIGKADASSQIDDTANALMDCMEQVYKELDIAEPVWVTKHARDLSLFRRTKFLPSDFIEPVRFDYMIVEYVSETH